MSRRIDRASRMIQAPADAVYRAFVEPGLLVAWLPPDGMSGKILRFEPWPGGRFRMVLRYDSGSPAVRGKTTDDTDVVEGRFVELGENERIVQAVTFQSEDEAFAGEMTITWTLTGLDGSTRVDVKCEDVPDGIRPEDHEAGLQASLANLASLAQRFR